MRSHPIRSLNVIAHIRKATAGEVSLENTHPFIQKLWGKNRLFAHNEHLPDFCPELTDNEALVAMRPGTLWMFHDGEVWDTLPSPFKSMEEMNACQG